MISEGFPFRARKITDWGAEALDLAEQPQWVSCSKLNRRGRRRGQIKNPAVTATINNAIGCCQSTTSTYPFAVEVQRKLELPGERSRRGTPGMAASPKPQSGDWLRTSLRENVLSDAAYSLATHRIFQPPTQPACAGFPDEPNPGGSPAATTGVQELAFSTPYESTARWPHVA